MARASAAGRQPLHGVGLEKDRRFRQWWSTARTSEDPPAPYDFLVNFGLPPEVVQRLSVDILAECCGSRAGVMNSEDDDDDEVIDPEVDWEGWRDPEQFVQTGAIGYVLRELFDSEKVQDPSFLVWKREGFSRGNNNHKFNHNLLADALSQEAPSRQELMRLFRLESHERHVMRPKFWKSAAKACLRRNHGSELLGLVFDALVEHGDNDCLDLLDGIFGGLGEPGYRPAIDHDCVRNIQKLLPLASKLNVQSQVWKESAFVEFVQMLTRSASIKDVRLSVPNTFVVDNQCSALMEAECGPLINQVVNPSSCGIEYCDILFSDTNRGVSGQSSFAKVAVLRMLPHMTRLKDLQIFLLGMSLETAAPYVAQAITNAASLKRLQVYLRSGAPDSSAMAILDALQNSSMEKFEYQEPQEMGNLEAYKSKLSEVVRHNTCLRSVEVRLSSQLVTTDEIDYYLDLNRNGRSTARNPNTSLQAYMDLLYQARTAPVLETADGRTISTAHFTLRGHSIDSVKLRSFNVLYGLLRETPGAWSTFAFCTPTEQRQRRKRQRRR